MGYLIEVNSRRFKGGVSYSSAVDELQQAHDHIRSALSHTIQRMGNTPNAGRPVRDWLDRVQLGQWNSSLLYVGSGHWEMSEVHRQLCQVEVLTGALSLLHARDPWGKVGHLSPTQQPRSDAFGTDSRGGRWALEVFGGVNVRNNRKAFKDATALLKLKGVSSRYFACFADAWLGYRGRTNVFDPVATSATQAPIALYSVRRA